MMSKKPYISIIIPTLNEEQNIRKMINGVKEVMRDYSYEIIVVDKHSIDKTVNIAKSLKARIIYDDKGKGSALIKGFNNANGRILISMDADLSHRPNELRLLVTGIESGYDMCTGSRFLTGGGTEDMPFIRKLGNKFFVGLVNLFYGSNFTDLCYGYRAFTKNATKRLHLSELGFGIETEMNIKATKAKLKILEIPSFEKKRRKGEAKLRTMDDGFIILKTILKNL